MNPQPSAGRRQAGGAWLVGMMGLAVACFSMGCDPRMALYFLQPFDPKIAALGPDLKGKTVVVLPYAVSGATSDFPTVDRDLARDFAKILQDNVKKIQVVPMRKVYDWIDSHPGWTDPSAAGRDLNAQMVILLEVESYRIQEPSSPGMFQGNSVVHIQVTEIPPPDKASAKTEPKSKSADEKESAADAEAREAAIVYNENSETIFPTRGPIPADSKVTSTSFQNRFLKVVAAELSWHFVPHESGDSIQDTRFDK